MIQFNLQTLLFFLFGCVGAVIPAFLEGYHNRTKKNKKHSILWEIGYVFIGGVVAVILTPANEFHALIFGATWEVLILNYVKKYGEKYEK